MASSRKLKALYLQMSVNTLLEKVLGNKTENMHMVENWPLLVPSSIIHMKGKL